jgi:hypothetical protein
MERGYVLVESQAEGKKMPGKKKSTSVKKVAPAKKAPVKKQVIKAKPAAKKVTSRRSESGVMKRPTTPNKGKLLTAEGWKRMMIRNKTEQKKKA